MSALPQGEVVLLPGGLHLLLLGYAAQPDLPETRALARGIMLTWGWPWPTGAGVLGLSREEGRLLLDCYFPGAYGLLSRLRSSSRDVAPPRLDEFEDLLDLLLAYRVPGLPGSAWIARAVAAGCMGEDHLWEDLGLPSRAALRRLLAAYFPKLVAQNVHDLRWKRFFYRQLCQQAEVSLCKAPSCGVCSEYAVCFGGA